MRIVGRLDDGSPQLGSGADFPASPLIGEIFEKTGDSHGPYYWSGTAWILILTDTVPAALGYTPVNRAGDSMTDSLSLPGTSGTGLKVNGNWAWHDIIGDVIPRRLGSDAPTLAVWKGHVEEYAYSAGDRGDSRYHIPHHHVPGSDLNLHVHWGHNGTSISGSLVINLYAQLAERGTGKVFGAEKVTSLTVSGLNTTNSPFECHRVDEIQLSNTDGSSSMFKSSDVTVDSMILLNYEVNTIPTISGSVNVNAPYIFTIDIHHLSTNVGTPNKDPDYYA